jgi:hypothetical protein
VARVIQIALDFSKRSRAMLMHSAFTARRNEHRTMAE